MTRPDYCPIGGEPCQSLCDEPCGSMRSDRDVTQAVERLKAKLASDPEFAKGLLPNMTHAEVLATLRPRSTPSRQRW